MEYTLNKNARENTIKELFNEAMEKIKANLNKGVAETELYIDKDFAGDVRSLLEKELGEKFTFCIVRTGNNPHTGRVEHFTGMLVGDQRYYKVKFID
jgi:hypothetical protein